MTDSFGGDTPDREGSFNRQLSKLKECKEVSLRDAGNEEEIIVHWVNKYGVPMDIKTRRGGMIHALWQAEHERRSRKRLEEQVEQPKIVQALEIETEVTVCQPKQLLDDGQSNP